MVGQTGTVPKRYKVLITGSSGMLGIDLSKELSRSYDVIGFDIAKNALSSVRKFIKGDITNRRSVEAALFKIRPDIVIHSAAWTDVDGCERDSKKAFTINAIGTRNVASACKKIGATIVYISTDFVFNGRKKKPYVETDKTGPLSIYGTSKLKGEEFIKKTLDRYCIIRTSWLYGKHGKNFVDTIAAKANTEKALNVVCDQVGSPTYTKYLAKALGALLDTIAPAKDTVEDYSGIYHVSNTGKVSWFDYARSILKIIGSNTIVVPITSRQLARPASRPAMSVMDGAKFYALTGYKMPHWKMALQEYLRER